MGGILVADEVFELLLAVLFFRVRAYRWRKIHRGNYPGNAAAEA